LIASKPSPIAISGTRKARNETNDGSGSRAVVAANGALRRLSVDEPSLETIYARYFQQHADNPREVRDAA
jgi:hypothetical protein